MAESQIIQFVPGDSPIHRMDSVSKLMWVLLVAVAMLTFRSWVSGAVMLVLMLLMALVGARIRPKRVLRSAPLWFGVGLMLACFHAFIQPGNPIVSLGPLSITDHGIAVGAGYFFRISVVVSASQLLLWTTDIRDLMAGLIRVGIPYKFAFAAFITLRFLPVIQREVEAVRAAHAIRGAARRSGLRRRLQLWQRYVFTVLVNGLRKAEFAAAAAQLRAFGSKPVRTFYKPFHWTRSGLALVALFAVIILGLHIGERLGLATLFPSAG